MDDKMLTGILVLIIPKVIDEIVSNEAISEITATENFYNSYLYSILEEEKTKLWHLSPKALYELYRQEQTIGFINFPEEA